jgi:hypothetical protein
LEAVAVSLEKDFRSMMNQVVTFNAASAVDKYGKQSFATASSTYYSRIIWSERILRDKDGREIVEAGRAILYGVAASVTPLFKITLPDGSTPKITSVETIQDEDGNHHSVVGFGQ